MLAYIYTSTFYVNKINATHPRLHISCFSPEQFCIIFRVGEAILHHSMPQLIYEPLAACYKELRHLSYPVLRRGTRRLHAMQCSIKRGPKANAR